MRHKGGHSGRGAPRLAPIATTLLLVLVPAAPAFAGQVAYPKAAPKIELRVPDDWAVAETGIGLEIEAPRKDSLVVAAVLPRDKAKVDAWVQTALARMRAEGVAFLNEGEMDPQLPEPEAAQKLDAPSDKSADAGSPEIFTFSGSPAVGQAAPPSEQDYLPKVATKYGLPPSAMATGEGAAINPFSHFYYKRTSMHGKQVDVELALFTLGKDKVFVIEQMSGPVDPRGVMIVRSLRATS